MVAAVQRWPSRQPVTVHRTFLAPDGSGKADVRPVRLAAIRLAPPSETLLIAEGIETALSALQETEIPAWAAISASNMLNVQPPEFASRSH